MIFVYCVGELMTLVGITRFKRKIKLQKDEIDMNLNRAIAVTAVLFGMSLNSFAEESCPKITNIPKISQVEYGKARGMLISAGWKPIRLVISAKDDAAIRAGASDLIDSGYFEIQNCDSRQHLCALGYRDKFGNLLEIVASDGYEHKVIRHNIGCMADHNEWDDRAAIISKGLILDNSKYLTEKIFHLTHPSGSEPTYAGVAVAKYGDKVSAEVSINWHGGLSGNLHKTTIAWAFNKDSHISVTIKSDTAPFAVTPENLKLLNKFFETEVYPLAKEALIE